MVACNELALIVIVRVDSQLDTLGVLTNSKVMQPSSVSAPEVTETLGCTDSGNWTFA